MTHKIATVTETRRYDKTGPRYEATLDCAQPHERSILLDSPQWFAWLEAPENDAFSYALHNHAQGYIDGFMTVRKERRLRGGAYWSAYRRQGRRLRKIYLGPSASVTEARLRQVAARLYAGEDPGCQPGYVASCPTATANSALKEEKPVVALIRTMLRCVASAIQVTRHHDQMTRFLMITLNVLSIQLTRFHMIK